LLAGLHFGGCLYESVTRVNSPDSLSRAYLGLDWRLAVVYSSLKMRLQEVNRRHFWMGFAIFLLSLIGLITVVAWLFNFLVFFLGTRREQEKLARFIEPVVMCDPVPFAEGSKLDNNLLLEMAMNNIFIDNKKKYVKNKNGEYMVPQGDVEVSVAELFGDLQKLKHQSLRDLSGFFCVYRPEESAYCVQLSEQANSYVPKIAKMKKENGAIVLTVDYLRPRMLLRNEQDETQIDKHMVYKVRKEKRKYRLLSVEDFEVSAFT
jgi:hypothetical protein